MTNKADLTADEIISAVADLFERAQFQVLEDHDDLQSVYGLLKGTVKAVELELARRAEAATEAAEAARPSIDEALEALRQHVKTLQDAERYGGGVLGEWRKGRKYAKLVVNGAAFCFVDLATGDVLKAASWKAPAKGVRGNVYTPENYGVTAYGTVYFR